MKVGIALDSNLGDRRNNNELGFAYLEGLAANQQVVRSTVRERS